LVIVAIVTKLFDYCGPVGPDGPVGPFGGRYCGYLLRLGIVVVVVVVVVGCCCCCWL
jgi:hypothetical protein